jgi:hypothetical protein
MPNGGKPRPIGREEGRAIESKAPTIKPNRPAPRPIGEDRGRDRRRGDPYGVDPSGLSWAFS